MTGFLSTLTPTKKAGLLVALLGLIAAFAGSPYKGSQTSIDATELAAVVEREVDHVSPEDLADWIIQGRSDYRLLDLRTEAEFNQYHIPGSENVPLTALAQHGLMRNEKILLYSEGGIHSAQAWFLLKAQGYKGVYMVRGGLEEWKDLVLFPQLAAGASPEQQKAFEKAKHVSAYFGGTPQTGEPASTQQTTLSLPTLKAPSAPAPTTGTAAKKKKKEGC